MKKILSIFLLTQILFISNLYAIKNKEITSEAFINVSGSFETITDASVTPHITYDYMYKNYCKLISRSAKDNEYLYAVKGHAYEADTSSCDNNTKICVLNYSTVDTSTKTNQCWIADVPRGWAGDLWKPSGTVPDCALSPWTTHSSEKLSAFITKRKQIMLSATNNNLIKTLIGVDPSRDYDMDCVVYICKHDDGRYSYGCPDGSCPDIDTECPGTEPDPEDPEDPGSGSGGSTPPPEKSEVIHRNTVQPYLDALKIKCPSVGK